MALVNAAKQCASCKVTKPVAEFSRDVARSDGRNPYCLECTRAKGKEGRERRKRTETPEQRESRLAKMRDYKQQWYATKGRDQMQERRWQRLYGLTPADVAEMTLAQGGVCAICKQPETRKRRIDDTTYPLSVDHCHETGLIRGLLCSQCNIAIGLLDHDPEILQAAIAYLTKTPLEVVDGADQ